MTFIFLNIDSLDFLIFCMKLEIINGLRINVVPLLYRQKKDEPFIHITSPNVVGFHLFFHKRRDTEKIYILR